jgi:TM2 domain-containing membrane protein YozV
MPAPSRRGARAAAPSHLRSVAPVPHVVIHTRRFAPPLRELRHVDLPAQVAISTRNRKVAAALAFTLGWAGAHKVYLMRPEQALLSVLFCWTLIPALLAIAEGVTYLMMSDAEFARDYDVTRSWLCRLARAVFRQPTRPARGYEFKPYVPW